jgi:exodeoxyribonuclease VII large subunit
MSRIPSKYYSLSQIATSLQSVIRSKYTAQYWIKAEIVKLNFYPKSGHCYPDLVEKDQGQIKAQMRAIIWSRDYFRINAEFVKLAGRKLSDGMEILFRAKPEFHPVHGLSLMITEISVEFVMGQMAREKQLNLERLKKAGLFNLNKQLKRSVLPQRIAIISVDTSKGFHDFINIIDHNSRGYKFFWMLFPALLQGDGAVKSIMQQLERIRRVRHHFDLVAIIRGGGGDVGLSCYDNYELASEVATFELPVITGIGHSTNETLVEMVSHYNPITPTDLAYFLQQQFDNQAVYQDELRRSLIDSGRERLKEARSSLENISRGVQDSAGLILLEQKHKLSGTSRQIRHRSLLLLQEQKMLLERVHNQLNTESVRFIQGQNASLEILKAKLPPVSSHKLEREQLRLRHFLEKIDLMKPENLLQKGYSITLYKGAPLKDTAQLKAGERITTRLFSGEIESEITKLHKK